MGCLPRELQKISAKESLAGEEAREEAWNRSTQSLINEIETATSKDTSEIRDKLIKAFRTAATSDQRATVLALFTTWLDRLEQGLEARGETKLLGGLREARAYDYKSLVYEECMVGLHSPRGADVSVDKLMEVTNRDIAAGRMTEDHSA